MMQQIQIKLEGIQGYSTCLVFENDDVRVNIGAGGDGNQRSVRVANITLEKVGAYITGGPEFVSKIEKCKTDDGKWDGTCLLALGFATFLDHLREHPSDFLKMLKEVEKMYNEGYDLSLPAERMLLFDKYFGKGKRCNSAAAPPL